MKFIILASHPESLLNFRGDLIRSLIKKNFEVHAVAPNIKFDIQTTSALKKYGVKTHSIPFIRNRISPLHDLVFSLRLLITIKKIKPYYFIAYTAKPVIYGLLAAYIAGVKNIFALITGLGYGLTCVDSCIKKLLRTCLINLYKISLRNAKKVIFQNPDDKYLFESLKITKKNHNNIIVNGSGVNLKYFSCSKIPEKISFIMISRLLGNKGVREYASAAKQLKNRYPKIDFKLVGWLDKGPDSINKFELDSWVENGFINFLGKLDDVRPVLKNSAIYVLPSYREGTPRTVLEAMALGRPIITTDSPGCRETVNHGKNGFLIPIKDSNALMKSMEKFINNPSLIRKMGLESRKIAEEKYDVHKVNAVMLKEMGIS